MCVYVLLMVGYEILEDADGILLGWIWEMAEGGDEGGGWGREGDGAKRQGDGQMGRGRRFGAPTNEKPPQAAFGMDRARRGKASRKELARALAARASGNPTLMTSS